MRKYIVIALSVFLSAIAGFVAFLVPTTGASADTNCTTTSDGTTFCNTQVGSISYGSVSTSTLSVASSDVKGKVNLQFQNPNGFKTSAACVTVNSFAAGVKHKCFIVSKKMVGMHYANSGISRYGTRYYFDGYVGDKYTPVGSRFYWDSHNRTWRKGNCGNFVRFNVRPKLKVASVALVKTFSSVKVTVKATQTATETVTSTASCAANGTSASATAKGTGTATGTATATAYAKTQSQATASATSQVKSIVQSSASAAAYAAAKVNMTSQAWVSCSSTSQPTPTPTPSQSTPPASPPSLTNITVLNDVDAGGTSPNFCATANLPGSDSGTLMFSANFGSFTAPSTWTVSGMQTECTTYVAPTEVPSGGKDTITVTLRDNVTGLSAPMNPPVNPQSFPINQPASPPA